MGAIYMVYSGDVDLGYAFSSPFNPDTRVPEVLRLMLVAECNEMGAVFEAIPELSGYRIAGIGEDVWYAALDSSGCDCGYCPPIYAMFHNESLMEVNLSKGGVDSVFDLLAKRGANEFTKSIF